MSQKIRVLFICKHNSARSQIAEALLNQISEEKFTAESAGFDPGTVNVLVIEALLEKGIDIKGNKSKSVFELYQKGRVYHYVIALCYETTAEKCPIFPGIVKRINWSFPDPGKLDGSYEDKLMGTKVLIEQIKKKIEEWVNNFDFKKEEEYKE